MFGEDTRAMGRVLDVTRGLAFHKVLGQILGRWVFVVDVTRGVSS